MWARQILFSRSGLVLTNRCICWWESSSLTWKYRVIQEIAYFYQSRPAHSWASFITNVRGGNYSPRDVTKPWYRVAMLTRYHLSYRQASGYRQLCITLIETYDYYVDEEIPSRSWLGLSFSLSERQQCLWLNSHIMLPYYVYTVSWLDPECHQASALAITELTAKVIFLENCGEKDTFGSIMCCALGKNRIRFYLD